MSTEKELSKAERVKKGAVLTMQYSCPKLKSRYNTYAACIDGADTIQLACIDGGSAIAGCIYGATAALKR
jgi:hypothetical protein